MSVFARCESKVQSYARQFPALFDRADGAHLIAADGRRYLDFFAGAGALNYGHNDPRLKAALIDYIVHGGIAHSLDLHTSAKALFLEQLEAVILGPRGLPYVVQFTGPTGTNATEAALKLARKVTGRTNVVTFTNGFHGVSAGALSVTGNRFQRAGAGLPLFPASVMPYDGYFGPDVDTMDYVERMLDDPSSGIDLPAAAIVEAVQGEGGLNVAGNDWLRRLSATCKRLGIVLIVDEVQTGCGRTGEFFAFERSGIVPDIVTMSKSLSGYGLPLAVVLIRRELDQWQPGEHNGTFRGNNMAFITAAAALDLYWRDAGFSREIARKGDALRDRLTAMHLGRPDAFVGVRGRGMMRGLVCADPAQAAAIGARAFDRGLVIERAGPHDEVLKCLAPLTIAIADLHEGLDILEAAATDVLGPVACAAAA